MALRIDRTDAAVAKIEERLGKVKGVESWFVIGGIDFTTNTAASNVATIVVVTTPWDERKTKDLQLNAILAALPARLRGCARSIHHCFWLSSHPGFEQHRRIPVHAGRPPWRRARAAGKVGGRVGGRRPQASEIGNVVNTFRSSVPTYRVDMDLDKLQTLGVPVTDAYNTLQTFLGGLYVNDFNRFSHTWQVLIQAEPEFRSQPSDIDRFYVRSVDGNMVPLGTLASIKPSSGPEVVFRYNRFRAIQILGFAGAGRQFRASHRRHGKSRGRKRCLPATATNGPAPPISRNWRRDTKA